MGTEKFNNRKIRKLEDLQAWIEARKLAKMLFELTKSLPSQEKFGIATHINQNARHIPANIAEGFGRFYLRDSTQFYRIALGSVNEVRSDIYLCFDRDYISREDLLKHLRQIDLVEKLIVGIINSASKIKPQR